MALATANAATLQGSVGGGYQYTTSTSTTTEEGFSTAISSASFSTWTDKTNYDNTFKTHVDTVTAANGATWQAFKGVYLSDAFIATYVNDAAVSPDFKT